MATLSEIEQMIADASSASTGFMLTQTSQCFPDNAYLYHTTSPERAVQILQQRRVATGEFSTYPISGLAEVWIRFWKYPLWDKGIRPVWWWSADVPEGFADSRFQFTQPEECAWVMTTEKRERSFTFERSDVVDVVVGRLEGRGFPRRVRNAFRAAEIDVEVNSLFSAEPLYVKRR